MDPVKKPVRVRPEPTFELRWPIRPSVTDCGCLVLPTNDAPADGLLALIGWTPLMLVEPATAVEPKEPPPTGPTGAPVYRFALPKLEVADGMGVTCTDDFDAIEGAAETAGWRTGDATLRPLFHELGVCG